MRKTRLSALLSLVFAVLLTAFAAAGCTPSEKAKFNVKFLNFDGTELLSVTLEEGSVPEYTGETPVKAGDAQYSYSFDGWDKELSAVSADTEYTAVFGQTLNRYDVTFKNHDGVTLQTSKVDYGSQPAYAGETPAKPDDNDFAYTFKGWDKELAIVTGETEYTAQFDKTALFTVTFKNYDGTVLQTGKVKEGTVPQFTGGGTPLKPSDGDFEYTFKGWDKELAAVTGAAEYTAQFDKTALFTVTFKNHDGTVLQTDKVKEGTTPEYKGETPTKTADAQYTYTFDGWDKQLAAVTEAVEYTAQFTQTVNKYIVTFKNYDGTVLQTGELDYGAVPEYTEDTPTRQADAQYTYTFKGWNTEPVAVTGAAEYTATFNETLNTYKVEFKNHDGAVLQTGNVEYGTVPEFTAATPAKAKAAGKAYLFKGWNAQPVAVTGAAEYTAQFYETRNLDGWYFEEGVGFTLPDLTSDFDGAELNCTFGGEATTVGATLNKAAGNYTFTVATDSDSIDFSIDVLSTAEYKENYLKANTSQFGTSRFGDVNGNNALYYDENKNYYVYKVNTDNTWANRIQLSSELVGGNIKTWTLTDYAYLAVDFCVLDGSVPKEAKYTAPTNIKNDGNVSFQMLFGYDNGLFGISSAMKQNVWYTAYMDLSNIAETENGNDFRLYFYADGEKGSFAMKNIRFLSEAPQELDSRVRFVDANNRNLSVVELDEAENEISLAYKYTKTTVSGQDVVWNTRAQIQNTAFAAAFNAVQFDMFIASSSLEDENGYAKIGFQTSGAQPINAIFEKGKTNAVGMAQMKVGKWYTVQLVNKQSAGDMYIYFAETVVTEIYFANAEYLNADLLAFTTATKGGANVTVSKVNLDETFGAVNNVLRIEKKQGSETWGAHTHFDVTAAHKAVGNALTLDIYIYESTVSADGLANAGFQLNTNITGQKIVDKATGETVTHSQMKLNTWYTVTATVGTGNNFYIYFGQGNGNQQVGVKAYVANACIKD